MSPPRKVTRRGIYVCIVARAIIPSFLHPLAKFRFSRTRRGTPPALLTARSGINVDFP